MVWFCHRYPPSSTRAWIEVSEGDHCGEFKQALPDQLILRQRMADERDRELRAAKPDPRPPEPPPQKPINNSLLPGNLR